MPANDVRGSFEVQALSGPWQGTIRWALASKGNDGKYVVATAAKTAQVDLQENETATIDISGSYYLTEGTKYYVVVWSPYFPNNYDWNWFFNDPVPFTVGDWVNPPVDIQPGDVDGNGAIEMDDLTKLINYLMTGSMTGIDPVGANANEAGEIDMDDLTALVNILMTM